VQKVIEGTPFKKLIWKMLFHIRKIKTAILGNLGLNPGKNFEKWISDSLASGPAQIKTMEQLLGLRTRKNFPDSMVHRITRQPIPDEIASIAIITSEITTQTKVNFPEMMHLYFKDPQNLNPAILVRTSMSVPLFFVPYEVENIPNAGQKEDPEWVDKAVYYGPVPDKVKFVDGGLISNFPINVFHLQKGSIPRKPTFGVRLSTFRENYTPINDFRNFLGSLISTMRYDSDNEFLRNNPDFNQLITYINADKLVNWLNFKLSDQEKQALFIEGAEKAMRFIKGFDWENYKKLRAGVNP
jgi:NTE family protein